VLRLHWAFRSGGWPTAPARTLVTSKTPEQFTHFPARSCEALGSAPLVLVSRENAHRDIPLTSASAFACVRTQRSSRRGRIGTAGATDRRRWRPVLLAPSCLCFVRNDWQQSPRKLRTQHLAIPAVSVGIRRPSDPTRARRNGQASRSVLIVVPVSARSATARQDPQRRRCPRSGSPPTLPDAGKE
jgi:hypothetical protein